MRFLIVTLLVACSTNANAVVYKCVAEDGQTVFQGRPCKPSDTTASVTKSDTELAREKREAEAKKRQAELRFRRRSHESFEIPTLPAATPYGDCLERAQVYQSRFEADGRSSDLVCYQKALERELGGNEKFNCPRSAQFYQTQFESSGQSSDLVCYQQALERELR